MLSANHEIQVVGILGKYTLRSFQRDINPPVAQRNQAAHENQIRHFACSVVAFIFN